MRTRSAIIGASLMLASSLLRAHPLDFSLEATVAFRETCAFISSTIEEQKNGSWRIARQAFAEGRQRALTIADPVQRDFVLEALDKMEQQRAVAAHDDGLVFVYPALAKLVSHQSPERFAERGRAMLGAQVLVTLAQDPGEGPLYRQLAEFCVRYATDPVFEVTFHRDELPSRMGRLAEHEDYAVDPYFGQAHECQSRCAEIFHRFVTSWRERHPDEPLLLRAFDGTEDSRRLLKGVARFERYHSLFGIECNEGRSLYFDPWFRQGTGADSVLTAQGFVERRLSWLLVGSYGAIGRKRTIVPLRGKGPRRP